MLYFTQSLKFLSWLTPCSSGLLATSQQYFSLRTNQQLPTINQQAVFFSQNKSAPATNHCTSRPNML
jgi:uncharacterized lipoprotein YmbA